MKYNEIIRYLASKPGKPQRMKSLINYVRPGVKGGERKAVRAGIDRVIDELVECGLVEIIAAPKQGGFAWYIWIDTTTKEK